MPSLREAWTRIVQADDYDWFMQEIGQAQANADLVSSMLPEKPGRLLFAGAGTGQMLEHMEASLLGVHRLVFTDININFLRRLEARLRWIGLQEYELVVDDLENSALRKGFDAAFAVLVLEHIDWRKGVETLSRIQPGRCVIVIQQNPPQMAEAVTPGRVPPGSMGVFVETRPRLIIRENLLEMMAECGFLFQGERSEQVADGKRMTALLWVRYDCIK